MEIEPVITIAPSWMRKDSGIRDDHYVVLEKKKIFIGNKQIIDHGNKSNGLQIMLQSVCVCVYLRTFTMKLSSVWNSWNFREQVKNVMMKTLLSFSSPSLLL